FFVYTTEVWEWTTDGGRKHKEKIKKTKLSWVGTREVARSQGNIVGSDPIVTDLPDALRIVVKFTDLKRNFSIFGGCHQPKKMIVNDYDPITGEKSGTHLEDDPYAFQKGLSKAQRNALTACIHAGFATKMIERFLGGAKSLPAGKNPQALTGGKKQKTTPSKADIKPKVDWDKIMPSDVDDFGKLQQIIWDLCKIQPSDLWKEFGKDSKSDMTKGDQSENDTAHEAFLTLKEKYCPKA
ncbi:hypothetical protein LCGC14_1615540, partial [marine sediment metagenome]